MIEHVYEIEHIYVFVYENDRRDNGLVSSDMNALCGGGEAPGRMQEVLS
jgi:hypothetical protein